MKFKKLSKPIFDNRIIDHDLWINNRTLFLFISGHSIRVYV